MFCPNSGRVKKESAPNEPSTLPAVITAPEKEGLALLAQTIVVASVTAVSL